MGEAHWHAQTCFFPHVAVLGGSGEVRHISLSLSHYRRRRYRRERALESALDEEPHSYVPVATARAWYVCEN